MTLEFHKQPVLMFDIYTAIVLVHLIVMQLVLFILLNKAVVAVSILFLHIFKSENKLRDLNP